MGVCMRLTAILRCAPLMLMGALLAFHPTLSSADDVDRSAGPVLSVKRVQPIPGTGLYEISVGAEGTSSVRAFLTSADGVPTVGEEFRIAGQESVSSSSARRNAATELAKNYGSITGRLQVINPFGDSDVDVPAEVAAYQLAVWKLVDQSGQPSPDATARIVERADALVEEAGDWGTRVPRPTPRSYPVSASTSPYLHGVRVTVAASGASPAGELVELRSGPDLLGVQRVAQTGKTHFDLPNSARYQGELTARWRGAVPAGTVVSSVEGGGRTLLLAGSLAYSLDSDAVEVIAPKAWSNVWFLAMDRGLPVFWAGMVGFLGTLVLFVGGSAVFGRITSWKVGFGVAAALLAGYVGLYLMADRASREFDASWTTQAVAPSAGTPIANVSADVPNATIELSGKKQTKVFSPACLIDDSPWSSWRPRRHTGPLATVRLSWNGNRAITSLSVLPGYFNAADAERVYAATGQPTLLQVFNDQGLAVETRITRPGFVDVDSGEVPTPSVVTLPGAWAGPIFVRVIEIEEEKDSFALAELTPSGTDVPSASEVTPVPESFESGPKCSST